MAPGPPQPGARRAAPPRLVAAAAAALLAVAAFVLGRSSAACGALGSGGGGGGGSGAVEPVAAYYQVHSNARAVREVLLRFRAVYPTAPVYIVNDGGDRSLAAVVAPFRVSYRYEPSITFIGRGQHGAISQGCNSPAACGAFLSRLAAAGAAADWVVLLEDDVHLVRPLSLQYLKYDISAGPRCGPLLPDYLQAIARLRGYARKEAPCWRGAGGSVFRGSALRALARLGGRAGKIESAWLPALLAAGGGALPVDKMVTSLVYAWGGTAGAWPGYVERDFPDYAVSG
ncbi:MAG: hypothetical protein J3K34DRAFT_500088 [Monoraphidium minutum]|nr:MAG: hypothetical protein J3K34DRAFT_500088 [Monoraphidium minutum]